MRTMATPCLLASILAGALWAAGSRRAEKKAEPGTSP